MTYVDAHCHLDRYEDPRKVLSDAEHADVITVAVTEVPSAFQRLKLKLGRRRSVRVALGLHPLRAGSVAPLEMALFARLLNQSDYVGEVGLDGSREGRSTVRAQIRVFEHLLQQPTIRCKVLTVHSRGAEAETIDRLASAALTAILHWYSGPLKHIDPALQAGLWFSVNPSMLRSQNGRRIVAALPKERIVTETDGPYTKVGRRPSEPRDVPALVGGLAALWGEDPDEARQRIRRNMTTLHATATGRSAAPR